ncbi:MAG TPA: hypothetical protein VI248_15220, partial [Kineosporiaceae bacterium]
MASSIPPRPGDPAGRARLRATARHPHSCGTILVGPGVQTDQGGQFTIGEFGQRGVAAGEDRLGQRPFAGEQDAGGQLCQARDLQERTPRDRCRAVDAKVRGPLGDALATGDKHVGDCSAQPGHISAGQRPFRIGHQSRAARDPVLDGSLRDQVMDLDKAVLAEAVRAVGGL